MAASVLRCRFEKHQGPKRLLHIDYPTAARGRGWTVLRGDEPERKHRSAREPNVDWEKRKKVLSFSLFSLDLVIGLSQRLVERSCIGGLVRARPFRCPAAQIWSSFAPLWPFKCGTAPISMSGENNNIGSLRATVSKSSNETFERQP